jgi:Ser/Thr protein kinase RdoA (MazF antagonist)
MDLEFLLDRPVTRMQRFWANDEERNLDLILTSAAEAREELLGLLRNEEHKNSWGPIGGDFHHSNTRFDANDNPTFFNFDLCGPGWRAYDIACFLLNTNLMHAPEELSEAFFAGYYSVRQLSPKEHAAISPFLTIRRIWLTSSFTMDEGLAGHTFIAPAQSP